MVAEKSLEYKCPGDLPVGSLPLQEFARRCSVSLTALKRHCNVGLAMLYGAREGGKERLEVTTLPLCFKPYRYLTPDQQRKALAFWERHNVPHRKPESTPVPATNC